MHFNSAVLITALVASVAAAPQRDNADPRTQRVIVNDFSARHKLDGTVESVGLHITGPDAGEIECSKSDGVVLGEKYKCGDSKYSFALIEGVFDTWGIRVYHQWGVASGASGSRDVPTICRAGPLQTTICTAPTPVWFYIGVK
ncbi:uncharacterized protein CTRU02_210476 [Colletotrichum truncatum]|uniref:Uncharacterized protein n=1 Tax=Colletotrichum truncatum TaxID=5467 RepID=A0ACC3YRA4_COLTU